jgi:hypothetical protein
MLRAARKISSISILDSAFTHASSVNVDSKLFSEPYYLSHANSKSLRLISAIQLDTRLGHKDILLAAAHPGSTRLITQVVETMAKETNSNLQYLDYQLICRAIKNCDRTEVPKLQWDLNQHQIKFTEAFSPGIYEIRDEPLEEDAENDTDIDDDDLEEDSTAMNFRFPRQKPSSKVNFNIVVQPLEKEGKEEKLFTISNISLSSLEGDNIPKSVEKEPLHTPYDTKLTNEDIFAFLDSLYESIRMKAQGGNERFFILLKDINDMLEGSNDQAGERLMIGLTQLSSKLRIEQVSCVLVVGSSPSITDIKNVSKDLDFYTQIIEGSVFTETEQRQQRNMAMDGTIFDTPLDSAFDRFEKIELLPPSAVYLSLQKIASKSKPSRKDFISNQQKLRQYLLQLETDLEIRLGQVNCASLIDICDEKGIRIDDALLEVMKAGIRIGKGRKVDSGLIETISSLTKRVWSMPKLERLVMLATGCQKEQPGAQTADIGPKALVEALGIIYETDISRFSTMAPHERENRVSPAEVGGVVDDPKSKEKEKEETIKVEHSFTHESVTAELKRRGIKLNTYEKRILSTVVNPCNF